jgi:plastocyanin
MPAIHRSARPYIALAALVVAFASAAAIGRGDAMSSSTPAPSVSPVAVKIANYAFSPQTITVTAGTVVKWTNTDSVAHTATAADNSFDSGNLNQNQSWSYTFAKPGKYAYVCSYHPNMTGTVIVTAAAATPAPTSGY